MRVRRVRGKVNVVASFHLRRCTGTARTLGLLLEQAVSPISAFPSGKEICECHRKRRLRLPHH